MKQLLLLSNLLLAGTIAASGQGVAVDADRVHVTYETVDNPITIGLENCSCKNLKLSVDNGQLRKGPNDCTYIFNSNKPGTAVFTLSRKAGNGYTDVGKITYRVKPLPLPVAALAGKRDGDVPLNIFKAQMGVIAKLDGFDFDVHFKVTSFQMNVIRDGKVYASVQNNNNVFELQAKTVIAQVLPGDTIVFDDIMCLKPDQKEIALESFSVNITK